MLVKIESNPTPRRWLRHLTVIVLLWVFLAQLTFGARSLSLTSDELPHALSGYVILATGDYWTVPPHGHPPLVNAWSAWPLLLEPTHPDPRLVPHWGQNLIAFTRALWPRLGPVERVAFVIRYPIMLMAVALMAPVYRWACDWSGHWGGVLAVAVMAFDPTLVAHSQLNTTDVGVTLFTFACLHLVERLTRRARGSWRLVAGVGLLLGATMAAKASGLLLSPVVAAILAWKAVRERGRARIRWLAYLAVIVVVGVVFLWGTYGFEWRPWPLASHLRLLEIFIEQKDRTAFLAGQIRPGGWWWYFPFAFAVKTPIPLILTLCVTLGVCLRSWRRVLQREITLWLFPLLYLATAIQGGVNIGYRHLLPFFPFVYVSLGRLGQAFSRSWSPRWRVAACGAAAALGIWYVAGTLSVCPFALAYFNEFIGGPRNGYRYLVDSNVDWGQSFKALQDFMDRERIDQVWLSYFTWVDPAVYGVRYQPLFPAAGSSPVLPRRYDPAPGVYAISATTLQGIALKEHDTDLYDWFRHREPDAQPGYGLLVYRVPPRSDSPRWLAQCDRPEAPLDPAAVERGLGRDDLRLIYFDCEHSWIYPSGGTSFGWYSLPRRAWQTADRVLRQRLATARLSYAQSEPYWEPAFVLFEQPRADVAAGLQAQARSAPPDWLPPRAEVESPLLQSPIRLSGPLTFLGYQSQTSGQRTELETWWRVEATPDRPLSILAHIVGADGAPVAVGDGLGVPIDQWQAGDVIVQRHTLTFPANAARGTYWVQTGAYWLDTLTRLPVEQAGQPQGDRLILMRVKR